MQGSRGAALLSVMLSALCTPGLELLGTGLAAVQTRFLIAERRQKAELV